MNPTPDQYVEAPTLRENLRDAIRWWEPMRLYYNVALAAIVVFVFWRNAPDSLDRIDALRCARAVILAGLANIAYCAVYPIELALVWCGLGGSRRGWRIALFGCGVSFAAAVTFVISSFAAVPF